MHGYWISHLNVYASGVVLQELEFPCTAFVIEFTACNRIGLFDQIMLLVLYLGGCFLVMQYSNSFGVI